MHADSIVNTSIDRKEQVSVMTTGVDYAIPVSFVDTAACHPVLIKFTYIEDIEAFPMVHHGFKLFHKGYLGISWKSSIDCVPKLVSLLLPLIHHFVYSVSKALSGDYKKYAGLW